MYLTYINGNLLVNQIPLAIICAKLGSTRAKSNAQPICFWGWWIWQRGGWIHRRVDIGVSPSLGPGHPVSISATFLGFWVSVYIKGKRKLIANRDAPGLKTGDAENGQFGCWQWTQKMVKIYGIGFASPNRSTIFHGCPPTN